MENLNETLSNIIGLEINDIDTELLKTLNQSYKEKLFELQDLKPKDRLTECEKIASGLPQIIKKAETIQVQIQTHKSTIESQLKNIQQTIKEKYNVDNSDDLRKIYEKTSNEHTQLAAAAQVISEELNNKISIAEEQYQNATKQLNDLNK